MKPVIVLVSISKENRAVIYVTARGSDGCKIHQNFHNNDLFSSQDELKMGI
jgi:hypothetical protein